MEESENEDISQEQNVREEDGLLSENTVSASEIAEYDDSAQIDVPKDENLVPFKKLPPLLRKSYSQRALKSRLLKKIYVPEDRELVNSLFVLGGNPKKPKLYAVPKDSMFSKKETKRYKKIVKEVKKQKGRVRFLPLAVLVGLIASIVVVVGIFKNPLVKKGIRSACEYFFQAKTDIASVNLRIFKASLTVRGLAIGNKDSVMKNLFEADKIELDFNLIQALRGKFVAQNIEVSGMAFNTDRKTSCEIPHKERFFDEDSAFMKELNARSSRALDDLKSQAFELLGGSDVESIVENIRNQLKTPETALLAVENSQALIDKWKEKPEELERQVNDFSDTIKDLQTFNVEAFKIQKPEDIETLRQELEKVNNAINACKTVKTQAESLVEEVKTDASAVRTMVDDVSNAAKSDVDFAKERLTTIAGALTNTKQLFDNALNTIAYNLLGKYYPYVRRGIALAERMKNESALDIAEDYIPTDNKIVGSVFAFIKEEAAKPKTEKKSKVKERMKGTTYWYSAEYPSFLIERVFASGPGFSAQVTEITNDPNVRNIPLVGKGNLSLSGVAHDATVTVDARKNTTAHLVELNYTGSGFKANIDGTSIATKRGVPSVAGPLVLSLGGTADTTGFTASGSVDIAPLNLTTDGFENEIVSKYYSEALAAVDSLRIGYAVGYNTSSGLDMSLSGNYAEKFVNALKNVIMSIGRDAKDAALKRIQDELNNSSNEIVVKAKEFLGIEEDIDLQNLKVSDLQKVLDKKKAELEKRIQDEVDKAKDKVKAEAEARAKEAENRAAEAVTSAIQDSLGIDEGQAEQATDAIKGAAQSGLNGLLKGFGH